MTDILQRLGAWCPHEDECPRVLIDEAAEEIERLRAELAAMRKQRDEAVEQYRDLLRRLSGSVSASPPRAAFLSGDASQKEGGGA
jgi:hypothetical protein